MRTASPIFFRTLLCLLAAGFSVTTSGCGIMATVAYWINGPTKVPAQFSGLEGKRVAVVCLDANSLGGPGGEADAIAKVVAITLANKVSDIDMVRQNEIADWIDNKGEDLTDYRDVGRGV